MCTTNLTPVSRRLVSGSARVEQQRCFCIGNEQVAARSWSCTKLKVKSALQGLLHLNNTPSHTHTALTWPCFLVTSPTRYLVTSRSPCGLKLIHCIYNRCPRRDPRQRLKISTQTSAFRTGFERSSN